MEADDLSSIPGIGPARARWLRAAFGTRTVFDLAKLSREDIEAALRRGRPGQPSMKTVEGWVAEARRLVRNEPRRATPARERGPASPRRRTRASPWAPASSFVVEFQSRAVSGTRQWKTSVHHIEADLNQTWKGIDCASMCRWMLERLPAVEDVSAGDASFPDVSSHARKASMKAASIQLDARIVLGDGVVRTSIVRIDQPWSVMLEWICEGIPPGEVRGQWQLDAVFRPIGGGQRFRLPNSPTRISIAEPLSDRTYRHRIDVSPGLADRAHVGPVYAVTASVAYRSVDDEVVAIAFADGGFLRFIEDPARTSAGHGGTQAS